MFLRGIGFGLNSQLWFFITVLVFVSTVTFFELKITRLESDRENLEIALARLQTFSNSGNKKHGLFNTTSLMYHNDTVIIYNRVPKTASTSFVNIAYDLCKRNGFNVLHLNITGNFHVMSLADQARFVWNVTRWEAKKPGLYHGHVGFINFERFGVSQRPIYINLLRKPLDRLVSYYYFLRYGDNYRPHLVRRKHGDKMTFDECVEQNLPDCNPNHMWLQIPFLCGHASDCWTPGSAWALEEAKKNLLSEYLVVGVMEQLTDFIAILEAALPGFFRGAVEHFKHSKKAHLRKTNQKLEPKESTIRKIQNSQVWQMETELYEFAVEQFNFLKKRMIVDKDGQLLDKGQQFMYEKISPK
ncbi:heparan sulfate 2-O-sulfotransferase [Lycorma delicatula]|uniref:heparan sulfate 2-O-sulfotransferase n=1 Tax=Lycorma delicatula TaxID=130591 RepID=UPI003F5135BD